MSTTTPIDDKNIQTADIITAAGSERGSHLSEYAPAFKALTGVALPPFTHPHITKGTGSPFDRGNDGIPIDCHPSMASFKYIEEKLDYDNALAAATAAKASFDRPLPLLDGPLKPVVVAAAKGMANITNAWAAILDANEQMGEVVHIPGAKGVDTLTQHRVVSGTDELALGEAVKRVYERVSREAMQSHEAAMAARAIIDNEIEKALKPQTRHNQTLEAEIRAHFKNDSKAVSFLSTKADLQTLTAVMAAPSYLSGLTDEEMASLRIAMETRFAGWLVQARSAAEEANNALLHAHGRFAEFCQRKMAVLDKKQVRTVASLKNLK